MKRLILCLLLALAAVPAWADVGPEIWRCVSPDGTTYVTNTRAGTVGKDCKVIAMTYRTTEAYISLSVSEIRKSGDIRRVWHKAEFNTRQPDGSISSRGLTEYDCKDEKSRRLQETTFSDVDLNGKIITTYSTPTNWWYIPPRTVADEILKFVCAK